MLGDEGSAFWLGHAAVRAGIRAADGRGPATLLFQRICEHLDLHEPARLVEWFYDQELSRTRVAQLARLVEQAAADGDEKAQDLLDQAARHLARAARAVERQLDFSGPFPLVLSGGAFRACPVSCAGSRHGSMTCPERASCGSRWSPPRAPSRWRSTCCGRAPGVSACELAGSPGASPDGEAPALAGGLEGKAEVRVDAAEPPRDR